LTSGSRPPLSPRSHPTASLPGFVRDQVAHFSVLRHPCARQGMPVKTAFAGRLPVLASNDGDVACTEGSRACSQDRGRGRGGSRRSAPGAGGTHGKDRPDPGRGRADAGRETGGMMAYARPCDTQIMNRSHVRGWRLHPSEPPTDVGGSRPASRLHRRFPFCPPARNRRSVTHTPIAATCCEVQLASASAPRRGGAQGLQSRSRSGKERRPSLSSTAVSASSTRFATSVTL
jgi:hypothetical protein